jgi:hypothetical protein
LGVYYPAVQWNVRSVSNMRGLMRLSLPAFLLFSYVSAAATVELEGVSMPEALGRFVTVPCLGEQHLEILVPTSQRRLYTLTL